MTTVPVEEKSTLQTPNIAEHATQNNKFGKKVASNLSSTRNLLRKWLDYLGTCWLTMLLLALSVAIALTVVLLFATVFVPLRPPIPMCKNLKRNISPYQNYIYIAHLSKPFEKIEIVALEQMLHMFPNVTMEITILHTEEEEEENHIDMVEKKNKRSVTPPFPDKDASIHDRVNKTIGIIIRHKYFLYFANPADFNTSALLIKFKTDEACKNITSPIYHKVSNFDNFLRKHHNVIVNHVRISEMFKNTPFEKSYVYFGKELMLFAVRVLKLWDHRGISFQLPKPRERKRNNQFVAILNVIIDQKNSKIFKLINMGRGPYDHIPKRFVTIDDEGLHIETKAPCHPFIAELIRNINAEKDATVPRVIGKSIL